MRFAALATLAVASSALRTENKIEPDYVTLAEINWPAEDEFAMMSEEDKFKFLNSLKTAWNLAKKGATLVKKYGP